MKALPLWQPWASLIAIEAKRVETRSWQAFPSLIGQRIAIHATKTKAHLPVAHTQPFHRRLRAALAAGDLALIGGELPLGALLATAVLDSCAPITDASAGELLERDPDEYAFGLYRLDEGPRWAWVLRDVQRLPEPIAFTGRQGIFNVPDELLGYSQPQGRLV